jgi:hypothetical protein
VCAASAVVGGHWRLVAAGAGVPGVVLVGLALEPSSAQAWVLGLPSPGQVVSGLLGVVGWLVAVPDYAPPGSHVAATERTVLAMAGAVLGAIATISIARFWVAGVAGSGGSALEGLARTVGAALLLPVWP